LAVGFASYEIARSGLTFNERGLNVTGHNIANVNTLGYTRQQAIAANSFYIKNNAKYGFGQVGIGVDVQQTRQIRHKFLDAIYRHENAKADYWNIRAQTFYEVENILGEPLNPGLQSLLNRYWDAWQELSKDPSSLTTRSLVRQLGESLAFEMNNIGAQLDRMQLELDAQFREGVQTLSDLCEKVAELNKLIKGVQITGEAANDYMDARNLVLDQISSLIDAEFFERDDGMIDVISEGVYLVFRDDAKRILTKQDNDTGMFHKAYVVMREGAPPILEELKLSQCKLLGILEARGYKVELPDVSLQQNDAYNAADPLSVTAEYNVLFGRGSITNGSPNTMADITIVIDLAMGDEYLNAVKSNISDYVDGLYKKGLNFNLKLVTLNGEDDAGAPVAGAQTVGEYSGDEDRVNAFIADVLKQKGGGDAGANDFSKVLDELDAMEYRDFVNRYTVLFTAESIDGDVELGMDAAKGYINRLHELGMSLSVVTTDELHNSGEGQAGASFGWGALTAATGGASVNMDEVVGNDLITRDFAEVMQDINDFINRNVNDRISMIPESNQILPDVRRRLNALINIICRSVNELHRSGKTLEKPPRDGEDFFVPITAGRPLELGNIMINPIFKEPEGLNYIVASQSGATEDNIIARAIANLRNLPRSISTAVGQTTFDDYYRDALYAISNSAAESERYLNNQLTVTDSLNMMRHSIMDVSMDEELSNMMKFKFGYDAAARVLNVIDSMIETIVNRLGIVGR